LSEEHIAPLELGQLVTAACDGGGEGRVLDGAVPHHVERTPLGDGGSRARRS